MHSATESVNVTRKKVVGGVLQDVTYRKPSAIECYNSFMGGVDVFDQLASSHRLLRRSKKFTKVLFYDMIEISTINSFKLMVAWQKEKPGKIVRPKGFSQYAFRENLVRQLSGLPTYGQPPAMQRRSGAPENAVADIHVTHTPDTIGMRANCTVCWKMRLSRNKSQFFCSVCRNREGNPTHLCITPDRKCFQLYHSAAFDAYR